jgi:hypothetical protein
MWFATTDGQVTEDQSGCGGLALDLVVMKPALIVYQFSREKVERGDFAHFLGLYGSAPCPTAKGSEGSWVE